MDSFILEKQNPWWETGKLKREIFPRQVTKELEKNLNNEKILALVGSRQVGKTSLLYLLIKKLLKSQSPKNIFYFNLDDLSIREFFQNPSEFLAYLQLKKEKKFIFIDEIQRLDNPGLFLKTIYDLKLPLKIIVSGSSQLELRSKLKEFLVGRIRQFEIPRLTFSELAGLQTNVPRQNTLEAMLLFGGYPEVAKQKDPEEKKILLNDIYQTYLQKDISDFAKIENIDIFNKLLLILASQIGGLLNLDSIAKTLHISAYTIGKYIDILEGTFIIKRIYPFFRNYKKEIAKTPKMYFLDLGLRNLILRDWHPMELRGDRGALFENFIFLELYANDIYKQKKYSFWRTTNQTEIDFIVQDGLDLSAIEVKYSESPRPKSFITFKKYYPETKFELVTKNKFLHK